YGEYEYEYEGVPNSPIIVEIEIGIGIGIDPSSVLRLALSAPQQYGWATRFLVPESQPASFRYRDR
ncbi:MAG TPA: hypothetical protein DEW46_05730, partial [Verrucomicrobia bacterium]|nr:hypothetical protein [Verrucomicrobiota bacterium]